MKQKLSFITLAIVALFLLFTQHVNGQFAFGNIPGTWTNTAMSIGLSGNNGFANALTDYQADQGSNFAAVGVFGAVNIPSTATVQGALGIFGSCTNTNVTVNCVGLYSASNAGAAGTGTTEATRIRLWGQNPLMSDKGFTHVFMTNEMDFNVSGTDTHILGLQFTGIGTQDMTTDSVGIIFGPLSTHKWPIAFMTTDACCTEAIQVGTAATGNNVSSQLIRFISRDSGGTTLTHDIFMGPGGGLNFTTTGVGNLFALQVSAVNHFLVNQGGAVTQKGLAFASLAPTTNGTHVYCTDCDPSSNGSTCASAGTKTGAMAFRINAVWKCY
jgi:hypothetical protein